MSCPSTLTAWQATRRAGLVRHWPVFTSYWKACHGQVTTPAASVPSPSGPPRWGQELLVAKRVPSTLYRAIGVPLTSKAFALPAGISERVAIFTNSAMLGPPFGRRGADGAWRSTLELPVGIA